MADSIRPLFIGMAHGLAGSAALMLIILATTQELGPGLLSIAVFGVGSIVGMHDGDWTDDQSPVGLFVGN
jgi:hypothetical protein